MSGNFHGAPGNIGLAAFSVYGRDSYLAMDHFKARAGQKLPPPSRDVLPRARITQDYSFLLHLGKSPGQRLDASHRSIFPLGENGPKQLCGQLLGHSSWDLPETVIKQKVGSSHLNKINTERLQHISYCLALPDCWTLAHLQQ